MSAAPPAHAACPAWVLAFLLVLATVLAYANSFTGRFVYDDFRAVVENPAVRSLWPPWPLIQGKSRPLVFVSLAVNYAIHGLDVWGYHAVNLALHAIAALALFGVVRRTLQLPHLGLRYGASAGWWAFSISLLWALHPLHTESVTYICQRAEAMVGMFALLTLYAFLRSIQAPRPWRWRAAAVAACSLGMLSKPVMAPVPILVLLVDRALVSGSWGEALRRHARLYVGLAATWGVLAAILSFPTESSSSAGFGYTEVTPWQYAVTQPGVILHYLRLSLWPQPLCLDYWWTVAAGLKGVVLPALALGLLLVITVVGVWRNRLWGLAAAWWLLLLAPTSSFIPLADLAVEHRTYLALVGVVVLVVMLGHTITGWLVVAVGVRPRWRWELAAGLVLGLGLVAGLRTWQRNQVYQDQITFWQDVLRTVPHNPRAYTNLGHTLARQGDTRGATACFEQAVHHQPNYVPALVQLSAARLQAGQVPEALALIDRALAIDPEHEAALIAKGTILLRLKRLDASLLHTRKAILVRPKAASLRFNLATILYMQGAFEEATQAYHDTIALDPTYVEAYYGLGCVLVMRKQWQAAERAFRRTVELAPDHGPAWHNLGFVLQRLGRTQEAEAAIRRGKAITDAR